MADGIAIHLDGMKDVLQFYAELKGIPIADVIRHAGNDIAYAAYLETPVASVKGKNQWIALPGRGSRKGEVLHFTLERLQARFNARKHRNFKKPHKYRHLKNLEKYRLHSYNRGFAKSVWIPLFKELGFENRKSNKPKSGDSNNAAKYNRGFTVFASQTDPYSHSFFKKGLETKRRANASAPLSDFSQSHIPAKGDLNPQFTIHLVQPALDARQFSDWAEKATSAGFARAGAIIARDMDRILKSRHPSKEKIDL